MASRWRSKSVSSSRTETADIELLQPGMACRTRGQLVYMNARSGSDLTIYLTTASLKRYEPLDNICTLPPSPLKAAFIGPIVGEVATVGRVKTFVIQVRAYFCQVIHFDVHVQLEMQPI